jgi:hypothetical protein
MKVIGLGVGRTGTYSLKMALERLRTRIPEDPKLTRLVDNAVQAAQRGAALT